MIVLQHLVLVLQIEVAVVLFREGNVELAQRIHPIRPSNGLMESGESLRPVQHDHVADLKEIHPDALINRAEEEIRCVGLAFERVGQFDVVQWFLVAEEQWSSIGTKGFELIYNGFPQVH